MKLSKNSWHYKLNKHVSNNYYIPPKSLCLYFWQTVGKMLALVVALGGVCLIGLGFLSIILFLQTGITGWVIWPEIIFELGAVLTAVILFLSMMGGVIATTEGHMKVFPEWMKITRFKKHEQVEKKPSLVVEYIKAKKEKVCPYIEWED